MRKLIVTFFGLGYGPVAPATWGSFGAVLVYLAVYFVSGVAVPQWALVVGIAVASVLCVALGDWAVEYFQARDPRPVVIDEVAGQWLTLLFVPMGFTTTHVLLVCASAFFLFRLFDVLKLPPARQLESLPAGWGILFDDLAAAVQANIVLQIVFRTHVFGLIN